MFYIFIEFERTVCVYEHRLTKTILRTNLFQVLNGLAVLYLSGSRVRRSILFVRDETLVNSPLFGECSDALHSDQNDLTEPERNLTTLEHDPTGPEHNLSRLEHDRTRTRPDGMTRSR